MKNASLPLNLKHLYTPKSFLLMLIGVFLAVFALKGFMIPNGFLDGGVTGISLLIHELNHINFSLLVMVINLLFIIPAYRYVGKLFAIRSFIAISVLCIGVDILNIEPITTDKLLIAIFGGALIGLGMGLIIRSGAAIDGFEVLAVFTTRKIGFSISEVILFFNCLIFLTAAFKFGIETAMYSIITYFAALKMADYVVDGIEEYIALTIISKEPDNIKSLLVNHFGKGITVYKGERGYLPGNFHIKADCDIVTTIVTRLELLNINDKISKIDPNAFMYTNKIKEATGGIIKQRIKH
jgi:uncharacterized membrane-anchored protein YitT (DUF2179 family)